MPNSNDLSLVASNLKAFFNIIDMRYWKRAVKVEAEPKGNTSLLLIMEKDKKSTKISTEDDNSSKTNADKYEKRKANNK